MARLAREEVFSPDEVAIVHVMNRVVRRCFILGDDSVTGKNYDHRKVWIEELFRHFASCFGIDLMAFAILSNHAFWQSRFRAVRILDDPSLLNDFPKPKEAEKKPIAEPAWVEQHEQAEKIRRLCGRLMEPGERSNREFGVLCEMIQMN